MTNEKDFSKSYSCEVPWALSPVIVRIRYSVFAHQGQSCNLCQQIELGQRNNKNCTTDTIQNIRNFLSFIEPSMIFHLSVCHNHTSPRQFLVQPLFGAAGINFEATESTLSEELLVFLFCSVVILHLLFVRTVVRRGDWWFAEPGLAGVEAARACRHHHQAQRQTCHGRQGGGRRLQKGASDLRKEKPSFSNRLLLPDILRRFLSMCRCFPRAADRGAGEGGSRARGGLDDA